METCACIFIIAASLIFFGLGAVGVYCVFMIARTEHYASIERERAKIALRKELLKLRMQQKTTRCEYEIFSKDIDRDL